MSSIIDRRENEKKKDDTITHFHGNLSAIILKNVFTGGKSYVLLSMLL